MGGNLTKANHKNAQKHYLAQKLPIVGDKLYSRVIKSSGKVEVNARSQAVSRIPSLYTRTPCNPSSNSEQSWRTTMKSPTTESSLSKDVGNNKNDTRKQLYSTSIQSKRTPGNTETEYIIGSNHSNHNVENTQQPFVQPEEKFPAKLQRLDKCHYQEKLTPLLPARFSMDYRRGDDGNCFNDILSENKQWSDNSTVRELGEILTSNYPSCLPIGDAVDRQHSAKPFANHLVRKQSVRKSYFPSGKPPTHPSKAIPARLKTPNSSTQNSPGEQAISPGQRNRKSVRLIDKKTTQKNTLPRCNSLPRPATADQGSPDSRDIIEGDESVRTRRLSSVSQQCLDDSQLDKSQCLARIEYTFYINDTEAHQRPFYDRRVEAVARACQCSICLHIPPQGHRPVYYKGMRVLPVTISAHSMIALKRCIARLDMQYPFFNVKAFCPTDMY